MSRKIRLLNLMKMREALKLRQQAQLVQDLNAELEKSLDMQGRLARLLEANAPPSEPITAFNLRSRAWYGRQMQEQLELASNRSEFLTQEIDTARGALAHIKSRENILDEKKQDLRRAVHAEKEKRHEGMMPPRINKAGR